MRKGLVIGGPIGEDAHVAGVSAFLGIAKEVGWKTVFLGPAVPVPEFVRAIVEHDPELVAVSYRLTPETGRNALTQLVNAVKESGVGNRRFVFGGTPPMAAVAVELSFFERAFTGTESPEVVRGYLEGRLSEGRVESDFPLTFVERLNWKAPFPLIRHHYGRPTLDETAEGIGRIAESGAMDVISLGIDQDAQEHFFHPERQDPSRKGAGGVPARSEDDYRKLYGASRRGNFPLMRVYSGTDDHLRLAELYLNSIHNAWCATSLFWFNQLDRRGPLDLVESLKVHQQLMAWHAQRGVPVEVNEPHHWGMRGSPDVIYVVASYLSAYNAKAMGVKDYIAQYMFNSPAGLSDRMDLAKVLACIELAEPLADARFRTYRQTRTGLLSHPVDPHLAKGHIGASVYLQMAVRPHIVHVVGFPEAHHATTAEELIESCKIARRAIENALGGAPDMTRDPLVLERKAHLISEARVTLEAIRRIGRADGGDPWTEPENLAGAVKLGILDAPELAGNPLAKGEISTRIIDGACEVVDPSTGKTISEVSRIRGRGIR